MNKQIEQLAVEAEFSEKDLHIQGDNFQKFAELIVKECASIARATPCPYEENEVRQRLGHTWDMASLEAGREIVKHFGIEE